MSRTMLALLAMAAFGGRGLAQAPPPRFEVRPFSVAFTPRNSVDRVSMSNVAIGGEGTLALRPNAHLVGAVLYVAGVDTRPDVRTRVQLWQLEAGTRYTFAGLVPAGARLRPFVGAGAAVRLYDLVDPGFPDRNRTGGYAALGVRSDLFGLLITLDSRTYVFEGDAYARRDGVPDVAYAIGVTVQLP